MEQRADIARMRILEELDRRQLSQRALAGALGWSPSRLGKVLNGKTSLDLNDLAAVCEELRLSLVEVVRDQGMEFCADMTPSEVRLLERIRQLPETLGAVMLLLDVKHHTRPQTRYAVKPKSASRGPRRV